MSRKEPTFEERLSKKTLQYICDFLPENWEFADKPDLQSKIENHGIEVVMDVYENEKEIESVIKKIWGKSYYEIDDSDLKTMNEVISFLEREKNASSKSDDYSATSSSPEHLIETIKGKIVKLNSGRYESFGKYGLYVFVETSFIDENFKSFVQQVIEEISAYSKNFSLKYSTIYLDQLYTLCVCNMDDKTFIHKAIPRELHNKMITEVNQDVTTNIR